MPVRPGTSHIQGIYTLHFDYLEADHFHREDHGRELEVCLNALLHLVGKNPLRVLGHLKPHGHVEVPVVHLAILVRKHPVQRELLPIFVGERYGGTEA